MISQINQGSRFLAKSNAYRIPIPGSYSICIGCSTWWGQNQRSK